MAKNILNASETSEGKYQVICDKCNCHFSFNKIDTYTHRNYDYGGGSDLDNYVDCPQCNNSIMVNSILSGSTGSSFMTMWTGPAVQQRVFNKVNVTALRATKDDNEFKRLLIQQLT